MKYMKIADTNLRYKLDTQELVWKTKEPYFEGEVSS